MKTYIIAEAGVNHNGSFEMAKQLVDVAKEAGADAVKFQTFKAENLVTQHAEQAKYQIENLKATTSQLEMLKKLELTYEEFTELQRYCNKKNIEFLSTPFDFDSLNFLVDKLNLNLIKIPSGELTNTPFIHYIATKRRPMILSTGMATIDEIHEALAFIAFGLGNPYVPVNLEKIKKYYHTEEARKLLKQYVTLLHCTTLYPAPAETINLNAMMEMKDIFNLNIGFSDHSEGINISIAAVAMGANVIEKHFTLDKSLQGPDHVASLNPKELIELVKAIREVEKAKGIKEKKANEMEMINKKPARKSLVAKKDIKAGEFFTEENLTIKRPGTGMAPIKYWDLLNKVATKDYKEDELIDE